MINSTNTRYDRFGMTWYHIKKWTLTLTQPYETEL